MAFGLKFNDSDYYVAWRGNPARDVSEAMAFPDKMAAAVFARDNGYMPAVPALYGQCPVSIVVLPDSSAERYGKFSYEVPE